MNLIIILLIIIIIIFFTRSNNNEYFTQEVVNYIQPSKIYNENNLVSNENNSPNISPRLLNSTNKLNLPKRSEEKNEQSANKNNKNNNSNISMPISASTNKYNQSGSSSSNAQIQKPYITEQEPVGYSEYLDYANARNPNPISSNYEAGIFSEQGVNPMGYQAKSMDPLQVPSSQLASNYSTAPNIPSPTNTQNLTNTQSQTNTQSPTNTQNSPNTQNLPIPESSKTLEMSGMANLTNKEIAKKLIKKAASLSVISTQNTDPVSSVQKANYAIGYLDALRDIMSDSEIKNLVNIDLNKFTAELVKIQNNNIMNMTNKCPSLSTDKKYLLDIVSNL